MATYDWIGDAPAVAQVVSFTVNYGTGGDIFTITINGKDVSVTGVTSTAATVAALVIALQASTIPEFAEVTWTDASPELVCTADTAGKPFTATAAVDGGGDGSIDASPSTTTANAGPNNWEADNFKDISDGSRGTLPGATDTLYFRNNSINLKYGLGTACVALAIYIDASYDGEIGLPATDSDGSVEYDEYRDRLMEVTTANVILYVGQGQGSASSKIRIKAGVNVDFYVTTTGVSSDDAGALEVLCDGNDIDILHIADGSMTVSTTGSDQIALVNMSGTSSLVVRGNIAQIVTASVLDSALLDTYANVVTMTMRGAPLVTVRSFATNDNHSIYGGTLTALVGGTLTTLLIAPGGTFTTEGMSGALTITSTTMDAGSTLLDSGANITFTSAIDLGAGGLNDVVLDLGRGHDVQKSYP